MTGSLSILMHGTFVEVGNTGVLITGPSGSGKSTLALRLMDAPGNGLGESLMTTKLVADDQVNFQRDQASSTLWGSAPTSIAGLMEVRGLGIASVNVAKKSTLRLIVSLVKPGEGERLPDFPARNVEILELPIPVVDIFGEDASAPARIRAAVSALNGDYLLEK